MVRSADQSASRLRRFVYPGLCCWTPSACVRSCRARSRNETCHQGARHAAITAGWPISLEVGKPMIFPCPCECRVCVRSGMVRSADQFATPAERCCSTRFGVGTGGSPVTQGGTSRLRRFVYPGLCCWTPSACVRSCRARSRNETCHQGTRHAAITAGWPISLEVGKPMIFPCPCECRVCVRSGRVRSADQFATPAERCCSTRFGVGTGGSPVTQGGTSRLRRFVYPGLCCWTPSACVRSCRARSRHETCHQGARHAPITAGWPISLEVGKPMIFPCPCECRVCVKSGRIRSADQFATPAERCCSTRFGVGTGGSPVTQGGTSRLRRFVYPGLCCWTPSACVRSCRARSRNETCHQGTRHAAITAGWPISLEVGKPMIFPCPCECRVCVRSGRVRSADQFATPAERCCSTRFGVGTGGSPVTQGGTSRLRRFVYPGLCCWTPSACVRSCRARSRHETCHQGARHAPITAGWPISLEVGKPMIFPCPCECRVCVRSGRVRSADQFATPAERCCSTRFGVGTGGSPVTQGGTSRLRRFVYPGLCCWTPSACVRSCRARSRHETCHQGASRSDRGRSRTSTMPYGSAHVAQRSAWPRKRGPWHPPTKARVAKRSRQVSFLDHALRLCARCAEVFMATQAWTMAPGTRQETREGVRDQGRGMRPGLHGNRGTNGQELM